MRRETDFVLEKAAWPTMLLEPGGRICRANQAARNVFSLPTDGPSPPFAEIWDDENAGSAVAFLQGQTGGETWQMNLRPPGGQKTRFLASVAKVTRDGQDYFFLQLFRDSGAVLSAPAPRPIAPEAPKPPPAPPVDPGKIPPALAQSSWPVLAVDAEGKIVDANAAAARIFGQTIGAGSTVSGICPPGDAETLSKLLNADPPASQEAINLVQANGSAAPFRVERSSATESKRTLLQFFRAEPKVEAPPPAAAPPPPIPAPVAETKPVPAEFVLQDAEWPAFVVNKDGRVLRVNRSGVRAFGSGMEKEGAALETIWSPNNRQSAKEFLNLPPSREAAPLKFRLKSGLPAEYWVQACATDQENVVLLQLLTGQAAAQAETPAAPKPAEAAPPAEPGPATPAATASAAAVGESHLVHKQKLDCALQLARSVALDFNNALTSILGHTSLLLSKTEAGNPSRNSLVEIEKSAAKAAEIANDLAAFSRQEKDAQVQVAGNLNTLLDRTIEMFHGKTSIEVSRHLERKLYSANFEEAKMLQALVKIFENAVESIKGPGKINVQTRNLELTTQTQDRTARLNPGNYVCVEISDTGEGIADDVMPRIFEPFFTTKGATHRGLGLAWVYGIVTNHGGGVAVSSQVGIGTAVRLYLPASGKIVRDAPMADGDLSGSQTVLFVDDEDLLLTMGQMVLSSYGYTVLTANSGQKALELFTSAKKKIDLVITDLVMPNMSGRELTEHILRAAPGTSIIWSSGYVRSANAQEQERYLQKPFSAQDLLRKVKQVLAQ